MVNLREYLDDAGLTNRVLIPPDIDTLLRSVDGLTPSQEPDTFDGVIANELPLPGFLSFTVATGRPAVVTRGGTPPQWQVDIAMTGTTDALFHVPSTPALVPAQPRSSGTGAARQEWLEQVGGELRVDGELVIRVTGTPDSTARMRLLPRGLADDELITVRLSPPGILFGETGIGMLFTGGVIVIDDNPTLSVPGQAPAWRGLSIPDLKLYVPRGVPLVGGTAITAGVSLSSPVGVDATATARVPAADGRPELTATVEWRDPAATRLGDLLPTLVDIVALVPVENAMTVPRVGDLSVGGGPIRVRARYARDLRRDPAEVGFTAALESDGGDGLVSVRATQDSQVAAKAVVTAAALATAVMADTPRPPGGDGSGAVLHDLLVAALGLSSVLTQRGRVVVHGVTIGYTTSGVAEFVVDYSADIVVKPLTVGGGAGFGVSMDPARPMRARFRGVRLRVDLNADGLDRYTLDHRSAGIDVEDPGGWQVEHLGSLFDVLGTRSGKGSNWFEVDLAFAIDLGPVRVDGATIRATVDGDDLDVGLRGLAVALAFPGVGGGLNVIEGKGQLRIRYDEQTRATVTDVRLAARIPPLNLAADAYLKTADHGPQGNQVLVSFTVDLPGPVPLGPTGLGVFGFTGVFGTNSAIALPPGDDIVVRQLSWDPSTAEATRFEAGSTTLGIGMLIGTAPDLGFTFSGRAMFALSVPDVAFNASLKGTLLGPRPRLEDIGERPDTSVINYLGALAYGAEGLTIGLRGSYHVPVLFDLTVPIGGHFPRHGNDWFLRVGGDGKPGRGEPVLLTILPDILDEHAWAFLMIAGDQLLDLFEDGRDLHGFSVGMGARWHRELRFGPLGLEMSAQLTAGIGTMPFPDGNEQSPILAAEGRLSGSLDLGPVSVAANTALSIEVGPGTRHLVDFHVCGEVDLAFYSIEGCVDFHLGDDTGDPPIPEQSPLTGVQLADRNGRTIAKASTHPDRAPVVWPDVVPVLTFSAGPKVDAQTPFRIADRHASNGEVGTDTLRYTYVLTALSLLSVTDDGQTETPVPNNPSATWWIPATEQEFPRPQATARNLSLLSTDAMPWMRTLADGGSSLPEDPIDTLSGMCGARVVAEPGWLLGANATRTTSGWTLPPEALRPNRFHSRVAAGIAVTVDGQPLNASWLAATAQSVPIHPGGPRAISPVVSTVDRQFTGGLLLPHPLEGEWRLASGGPIEAVATITFDEPVTEARLWLRVQNARTTSIRVRSTNSTTEWTRVATLTHDAAHTLHCYAPPSSAPVPGIRLAYHARHRVDVLGVRGRTDTASRAANAVNVERAHADDADRDEADGLVGLDVNLLQPDTLYKITNTVQARLGERRVDMPSTDYYFRTAAESGTRRDLVTVSSFAPVFLAVDRFDPTYLERYLIGYTPGDGTRHWYLDDPVAASFSRGHIVALATRYDYATLLRLRRTDVRPDTPLPGPVVPRLVTLIAAWQLAEPDRRLHALALGSSQTCRRAGVGGSLVSQMELEPGATYDLAVWFRKTGQTSGGRGLPGVVFTTSRYATPLEQFADLGFVSTGTPGRAGDLAVTAPTTLPPPGVGDGVFARVLRELGLDLRPAPRARTSALWVRGGTGWVLSGVLLESPEPLERPGMGSPGEVAPARVRLNGLSAPNLFDQVWRDSSGCRVLLRTTAPAVPIAGLRLSIAQNRPLAAGGVDAVTSNLACSCGTTPRFVEEI